MAAIPCSVVILTLNEERDLGGCLESVAWCTDIHVLDSGSTDRTCAIATTAGAAVHHRPFDNYAHQRNHALHVLPYTHPWLLILDADERCPPPLAEEIGRVLARRQHDPDLAAFRIRRRDFLHGRWLKHVQASPYYLRLVRPDRCAYTDRIVNEVLEPDGTVQTLTESFDHFPFSKGLDFWFERHNRYSRMEAEQILSDRTAGIRPDLWRALSEGDFHRRRVHQKALFYALPCRPLMKFLILYVLKRGFLDGRPGLLYAQLQACYEQMIVLKTRDATLAARRS